MTHVKVIDFDGNPNVGLYGFCTDAFCLVGNAVSEEQVAIIKDILGVPVHRISIAGTSLIGVFVSGTEQHIVVPSITFEHELEALSALNIPFSVIDTKFTALGNNVVVNDKGILVNPELETSTKRTLATLFNVPIKEGEIHDQPTVGSCLCITKKGGLIHINAADAQIDMLSDFFGVPIEVASVNHGVPQVSSGIIANSNGFVIGTQSTGVEVTNADEILGFLGNENE